MTKSHIMRLKLSNDPRSNTLQFTSGFQTLDSIFELEATVDKAMKLTPAYEVPKGTLIFLPKQNK